MDIIKVNYNKKIIIHYDSYIDTKMDNDFTKM